MSRHKKVGGRIMKYEKVPGCIMGAPLSDARKKKQEDNFICRHLAPSTTCACGSQGQVVKNHPLLFSPSFGGESRKEKKRRCCWMVFSPWDLRCFSSQLVCLHASSSGLTPPLHLFLPLALIIASQLINSLHISSFLATAWRV